MTLDFFIAKYFIYSYLIRCDDILKLGTKGYVAKRRRPIYWVNCMYVY